MFRTEIIIPHSKRKLGHKDPVFTIGSCFSDCMGSKFRDFKFDVLANPFGTVYNPISIANLLDYAIRNKPPEKDTYLENQGLQANYDFHSSFSALEKDTVKKRVELAIDQSSQFLNKTQWLIVTLGTAWVYERLDNGNIVSNCHKLPSRLFNKRLLSQEQIIASLEPKLAKLKELRPDMEVILTVSPVRHIKDTLQHNNVSKSTLRLVCERLANENSFIQYFPSYEIMMDDLRDYRFYKSDMIHPNEDAENYIWNRFSETYFDRKTLDINAEWAKIRAALNHKPFNPTSKQHQEFIKQTLDKIHQLKDVLPIDEELAQLKGQLV
ncbi:MAG: GSCFA domain-containing protein [Fulvivirga sp.]